MVEMMALLAVLSGDGRAPRHGVQTLDMEAAAAWMRYLCPMPQEIRVTGKITLRAADLRLLASGERGEVLSQGIDELALTIEKACGTKPDIQPFDPRPAESLVPIIALQSCDGSIDGKPNSDQAYAVAAAEMDDGGVPAIMCNANTEIGLYYGIKTLKQLMAASIKGTGEEATIDVPVCEISDWPDMEERGQWGGTCVEDMEWLSDYKFNVIEEHAKATVDEAGNGHATMDVEFIRNARRHGVRVVPVITHLERLSRTGIFEIYPKLRAVGAETSVCFAQPEIVDVAAQWLVELGRTDGVSEVMIWLSEEGKGCECEECSKNDRFINELRTCLAAWDKAKQTCPELGLRILLTQASYPSNDKILSAMPQGVKVSYYHGSLTYNTSRNEMIYPLLEDYVKQGRWLGVYPTITAAWGIVGPFTNPEFIHYRMNEFVDKGLACLVAYAVPHSAYYVPNVEAALEWPWNSKGRTPRQFAISYAVRHGMTSPDTFADWCETISPVSWDIYGSAFPLRECWGGTAEIVRDGGELGQTIFAEYKSEEQFDTDLRACEAALALADEMGDDGLVLETQILRGYTQVLKSVWQLSKLVHGSAVKEDDRQAASEYFDLFSEGCDAVISLYPEWSRTVAPQLTGDEPRRFWGTVETMQALAGRIAEVRRDCGFIEAPRD